MGRVEQAAFILATEERMRYRKLLSASELGHNSCRKFMVAPV